MDPVDVTVSIVNHRSRDAVLAGLAALHGDADRRARLQVIVVDNASGDGSVEAVRSRFPDVGVLARDRRAGYGANHNAALRLATGRHVLFLNDDAVVQPGAIDALADHLDSHPATAVAAPRIVWPDGTPQPSLWPRPSPLLDVVGLLRLGRPLAARPQSDGRRAVGWAMGSALMARRAALLDVGGFDEGYFMYSEEVDLCTRLADQGWAVDWVPGAVVLHEGQASTGEQSPERAIEMSRSRRRYWRRHYTTGGRLVAQTAVSLQFALLAIAARARGRPSEPFRLQATGCWRDPAGPGLRERAERFNEASR